MDAGVVGRSIVADKTGAGFSGPTIHVRRPTSSRVRFCDDEFSRHVITAARGTGAIGGTRAASCWLDLILGRERNRSGLRPQCAEKIASRVLRGTANTRGAARLVGRSDWCDAEQF